MKTKNLSLMMLSVTFGLSAVLSLGLTLGLQYANTDIVLYASILPEVLGALIELCEILIYSFGFSVLIAATYMGKSLPQVVGLSAILSAACVFRRLCDLVSILIVFKELGIADFIEGVTYLLLDLILVWAMLWLIRGQFARYKRKRATTKKGSSLFSPEANYTPVLSDYFPFRKTYSNRNPVQVSLLTIAIIRSAVKLLSRVIYDIGYGAPESFEEVLIMSVYYLSDLLIGVLFYAVAILFLEKLFQRFKKSVQ